MTFTVPQIITRLGIEHSNELAWMAGAAIRDAYESITGESPVKALRKKTTGPGSHCFAVYPEEFLPMATQIVRSTAASLGAEAARQLSFWGGNQ